LMVRSTTFLKSLTGIMMVHHATKHSQRTQKSSSNPSLTIVILSDKETTLWLCARPTNGQMPLSQHFVLQTLISATLLQTSGMHARKKNHGTVLNRNIPCSEPQQNSPHGLLDGPTMVTQVLKDLTIAQLVPMFASVESLLMLITKPVFTPELTFQEQMLK
jgi:hypothetical protein